MPKRMPTPRSNPSSSTYRRTLMASTATQNMIMSFSPGDDGCRLVADDRHRPVGDRADRRLDQAPGWPGAQQPVDVVNAKREDEAVECAEHDERDRCFAHGEKWGHRVRSAQDAVDRPWLPPNLGGEP